MSPRVFKACRKAPLFPAFSLIELLVVMAIILILCGITVFGLSNASLNARKVSREIIKTHLQQARAHAIATRTLTALLIPVRENNEKGLRAVSLIEVQKIDGEYVPVKNKNGDTPLLQRWKMLPKNFHFVTNSMIQSEQPTVVDNQKTLTISSRDHEIECQMIVFTPNGQIAFPYAGAPVVIAMAQVDRNGNTFRIIQTSNQEFDFDLLMVNRLTGRTRTITQ